ncbi:MAG TPA: hypothetical protein VF587_01615 [Solirubrobacteraceae bacterium]|jgi:hypothetical protein
MKLIRSRKKSPTTFERVTGFVKLGVKGLVVQRVARRGLKTYKFFRRAVPLAGLAAIGAVVAKKVRGDSGPSTTSYSAPASGGASSGGGAPAGTSAAAAATAATGTPPVNGAGAAAGPDISDALDDAGVEGSGPDTPKEAAAPGLGDEQPGDEQSGGGDKADSAYESAEAGKTPTDSELQVEGPNESTPPPPDKTTT